jgi:hypothetical protein
MHLPSREWLTFRDAVRSACPPLDEQTVRRLIIREIYSLDLRNTDDFKLWKFRYFDERELGLLFESGTTLYDGKMFMPLIARHSLVALLSRGPEKDEPSVHIADINAHVARISAEWQELQIESTIEHKDAETSVQSKGVVEPASAKPSRRGRPLGSGSNAVADRTLALKALELRTAGVARSDNEAARMVASAAGGAGTTDSKVRRVRASIARLRSELEKNGA